jgi:hypothetical protein
MTARQVGKAEWIGLFLAPAVFFAHLQVAYVLVPWSCVTGNHLWLDVNDALSVLVAATGALIARRVWLHEDAGGPSTAAGAVSRSRFLGILGTVASAMFVLLLVTQWSASWFISPCR